MNIKKKILSVIVAVAMVFSLLPAGVFAVDTETIVTIFTTNDIHGVVAASDKNIGLAQAAAMKASTANSLLVDAGDAAQGASFATITQGLDVIKMMNAAGYDVMAAGNHEFDYGTEQLLELKEAANFPILSANVTKDGNPLLQSNKIVEVGGKNIGFIGITTVNTATSTNPAKLSGVSFKNEIETAKEQINAIKDNVDAIVLVCHLGDNDNAAVVTSKQLLDGLSADELNKVAAVIDGHSHTVEQDTYTRGSVKIPIVQTGTQFTNIGMVQITFGDSAVSASCKVLDKAAADAFTLTADGAAKKTEVEKTLADIQSEQEKVLGQELCKNDTPLWGGNIYWDYSESRIVEIPYGDFVTDAFVQYAKEFAKDNGYDIPVIAVENGGGIANSLPAGMVTRGDVLDAFSHGNMVEVYEITPKMLRTALEAGLVVTGQDETGLLLRAKVSGSFLQVSGFSYTYNPAGEAGAKVTDITLSDGTKLNLSDDTKSLLLATNSYVGSGFSEETKVGELGGEDQIVMEYILSCAAGGSLKYKSGEQRIKIANDKSPAEYTVKIPVTFSDKTAVKNTEFTVSIDGGEDTKVKTNDDGDIVLTLTKGAHTISLKEADNANMPVYVNNYSGSGTVTTKDGYYKLGFTPDFKTEFTLKIEKYAQENIDYINDYFSYSEEIETAVKGTAELRDDMLSKLKNAKTFEEAEALYETFKDYADFIFDFVCFDEMYLYYKAGVKENADKSLSEQQIEDYCKQLDSVYEAIMKKLDEAMEAEKPINEFTELLLEGMDDIDAVMADANQIIIKHLADTLKEYITTTVAENEEWFASYDKSEETVKNILANLDKLLSEFGAITDIDKQNDFYTTVVSDIFEQWTKLNKACADGVINAVADEAESYIEEAEKDLSSKKTDVKSFKENAQEAVEALKFDIEAEISKDEFDGVKFADEIYGKYADEVQKFKLEMSAEFIEEWLDFCEVSYTGDIKGFVNLTADEQNEGIKTLKEAINAVRAEIADKTKQEISDNFKIYRGMVNLAYAGVYLTDIRRNTSEYIEVLEYVSDSDKADCLKFIEEKLAEAEKIINDKKYLEWETVDELYFAVQDAVDELWIKHTLLWTDKYALEEYDATVGEYAAKLKYVTKEQIDSARELLKSKCEETAKKIREIVSSGIDVYAIEDICVELQGSFDSRVEQFLEENAQRRITEAADEVKAEIKALEEKNGVDLSRYVSSVDRIMEEALKALTTKGDFGFTTDLDAIAKAFDSLEKTADKYEAQIRGQLPWTEDEEDEEDDVTDTGKDVPDTGFDMTMTVVLIVLSATLMAVLLFKKYTVYALSSFVGKRCGK